MFASLLLCGCSRVADYRAVALDQIAAYEETVAVLKTVHDAPSMAAARQQLEERQDHLEAVAKRAKKLGPPGPEIVEQLGEEYATMQRTIERLRVEIRRIQALPQGAEFLKSLDVIGP